MRRASILCGVLALCFVDVTTADELSLQAPAAAAAAPTTLWNFLGIPQGINKIRDATSNPLGNRPNAERKPPLKRIADPQNLKSENPAIKKAAEVKAAEDEAPQKVKALKYLARMGCGCYDQDGKITEAFMAALEDCTEEVRFQAAIAVLDAAQNNCETCNQKRCCSEELSAKLAKIAYEKNDKCCWFEPSERVRMAAADALKACCSCSNNVPPGMPVEEIPAPIKNDDETVPTPNQSDETVPNSARTGVPDSSLTSRRPGQARPGSGHSGGADSSHQVQRLPAVSQPATIPTSMSRTVETIPPPPLVAEPVRHPAAAQKSMLPRAPHVQGTIEDINFETRTAQVRFSGSHGLLVGHRLTVSHAYLLGPSALGEMEVIASGPQSVTVRPVGNFDFAKLAVGDDASSGKVRKAARATREPAPPVAEAPVQEKIAAKPKSTIAPPAPALAVPSPIPAPAPARPTVVQTKRVPVAAPEAAASLPQQKSNPLPPSPGPRPAVRAVSNVPPAPAVREEAVVITDARTTPATAAKKTLFSNGRRAASPDASSQNAPIGPQPAAGQLPVPPSQRASIIRDDNARALPNSVLVNPDGSSLRIVNPIQGCVSGAPHPRTDMGPGRPARDLSESAAERSAASLKVTRQPPNKLSAVGGEVGVDRDMISVLRR